MSAREMLDVLWLATWSGSLAIALILLLRGPLRSRFGAGIAYASWWLLPMVWLGLWLPARVVEVTLPERMHTEPSELGFATLQPMADAFDASPWWMGAWLLGVIAVCARMGWQQHRFERGLGRTERFGDDARVLRAESSEGLPALVGLLRPRIVLPADVEQRYDEEQRALMLEHERLHLRRGDAWINAGVALLRALFWFNPLMHVAASRLRHDQELACDERVVARHPQSRRAYGDAMLKTLMAAQPVPLGCHWGFTHPMKERIMMLKQGMPPRRTRLVGATLVALGLAGAGLMAWASQPPRVVTKTIRVQSGSPRAVAQAEGNEIELKMQVALDGAAPEHINLVTDNGKEFNIGVMENGRNVAIQGRTERVQHEGREAYKTSMTLREGGRVIATPVVITVAGKPARIQQGVEKTDGRFEGVGITLDVGPMSEKTRVAMREAELAAAAAEVAAAAAERQADEAERAADAAAHAAEHAAGTAARDSERAARDADRAARDAAAAADHAARAAAEQQAHARMATQAASASANVSVEQRRVHVVRTASAPPAPPAPPVPPTPPNVTNTPPPPPPSPPSPSVPRGARHGAAGTQMTAHDEVIAEDLDPAYRWARVDPKRRKSADGKPNELGCDAVVTRVQRQQTQTDGAIVQVRTSDVMYCGHRR